jgi:hypothetical protein
VRAGASRLFHLGSAGRRKQAFPFENRRPAYAGLSFWAVGAAKAGFPVALNGTDTGIGTGEYIA